MSITVTCRGCGIRVGRDAHSCWICKCPYPACHLSEASDPADEILDVIPAEMPAKSFLATGWGLAIPAGLGVLFTGVVVAGACFMAARWDRVQPHGLPSVNTFIARPR
jgi:hypothetical protein